MNYKISPHGSPRLRPKNVHVISVGGVSAHQLRGIFGVARSSPIGRVSREPDCSLFSKSAGSTTRVGRAESESAYHYTTAPPGARTTHGAK